MDLVVAVASGFALAMWTPVLHLLLGRYVGWLAALLPAGLTLWFARSLDTVADGGAATVRFDWIPDIGVSFALRLDGFSLLFVLLIAGLGTLICVYASRYLEEHPRLGLFYSYLLAFMAAMLGLVLAADLLTLYVFWELTTVTSYLLIGFEQEKSSARSAALQGLLVTAAGGLCLLAGLVLLGIAGGSFEIAELVRRSDLVRGHRLYPEILALILIGAFAKSAQFPLHFWLPNAMAAPTPVSAYLHSATMVKAGVYLLARLLPVLGGTDAWMICVTGVGAITMLIGAAVAFAQQDLKAILAYLTINVLGTLTMLVGLGTAPAIHAAVVTIVAHALYKGALFLVTGAIDHETGTRDIRHLSGLRGKMPYTAAVALIAGASLAGLLPLFGFIAKESGLEAVLESPPAVRPWLAAAMTASGAFLVAGAGLVAVGPFFGRTSASTANVHEPGVGLWGPPALLASAGAVLGLFPQVLVGQLAHAATASLVEAPQSELKIWHGVTLPLVLSIAAVIIGISLYVARSWIIRQLPTSERVRCLGPEAGYHLALTAMNRFAQWQTGLLQSGYLRAYVAIILATSVAITGPRLARVGLPFLGRDWMGVGFHEGAAVAVIVAATIGVLRTTSRLGAVTFLGVVGFAIAWLFNLFGAPDLAMTQLTVEALTVLVFVLAFYRLPRFTLVSSRATRIRDAALAIAAGGLTTLLLLLVTGVQHHPPISEYFVRNSVTLGHGRNIVNVILVDFRAFDTLGEITVLATAAIGVSALFRLIVDRSEESGQVSPGERS